MGKRILSALYNGELILGEQRIPDSEEYRKLIGELNDKRSQLNDIEEQKMDELISLQTDVLSYEVEDAFYRGFAAGVMLMQEVQSIQL